MNLFVLPLDLQILSSVCLFDLLKLLFSCFDSFLTLLALFLQLSLQLLIFLLHCFEVFAVVRLGLLGELHQGLYVGLLGNNFFELVSLSNTDTIVDEDELIIFQKVVVQVEELFPVVLDEASFIFFFPEGSLSLCLSVFSEPGEAKDRIVKEFSTKHLLEKLQSALELFVKPWVLGVKHNNEGAYIPDLLQSVNYRSYVIGIFVV